MLKHGLVILGTIYHVKSKIICANFISNLQIHNVLNISYFGDEKKQSKDDTFGETVLHDMTYPHLLTMFDLVTL